MQAIDIYPNAFQDVIQVNSNVKGSFAIVSSDGRVYELQATYTPKGVTLDASFLPGGLYVLTFVNAEGSWTWKVMKR